MCKQGSWLWKGIWEIKHLLEKCACYQVNSGLDTNIWKDPWIPSQINFSPFPLGAARDDIN